MHKTTFCTFLLFIYLFLTPVAFSQDAEDSLVYDGMQFNNTAAIDYVKEARKHDPNYNHGINPNRDLAIQNYMKAIESQPEAPVNVALHERIAQLWMTPINGQMKGSQAPNPQISMPHWDYVIQHSEKRDTTRINGLFGKASALVIQGIEDVTIRTILKTILSIDPNIMEPPPWLVGETLVGFDPIAFTQQARVTAAKTLHHFEEASVDETGEDVLFKASEWNKYADGLDRSDPVRGVAQDIAKKYRKNYDDQFFATLNNFKGIEAWETIEAGHEHLQLPPEHLQKKSPELELPIKTYTGLAAWQAILIACGVPIFLLIVGFFIYYYKFWNMIGPSRKQE